MVKLGIVVGCKIPTLVYHYSRTFFVSIVAATMSLSRITFQITIVYISQFNEMEKVFNDAVFDSAPFPLAKNPQGSRIN